MINSIKILQRKRMLMLTSVAVIVVILTSSPKIISETSDISNSDDPLCFVNFSSNAINFSSGLGIEKQFCNLIAQASNNQRPLNILHIGDSHVQADYFTGETRRLLAFWLDDSNPSRGFTFPYSIYGSNNPEDFKIKWSGKWERVNGENSGLSAVSIKTHDAKAQFSISLPLIKNTQPTFDKVRIIYQNSEGDAIPILYETSTLIDKSDFTACYKLDFPQSNVTVKLKNQNKLSTTIIHGVELLNTQSKFTYHAAGVNGATVKTFQQSKGFDLQLAILKPDIVLISLGTNDVYNSGYDRNTFYSDYKQFIERVKVSLPEAIIILTTPGDHLIKGLKPNSNLNNIHQCILGLAEEMGCGVWDFYSIMGGEGSIKNWAKHGFYSPDMIHLSKNGYKLQGALLFDALVKLTGSPAIFENSKYLAANE